MRTVVLGGGVAGLSVASVLARAGAHVTVLEGAAQVGGLASGFRDRGYTFDLFSHRLWSRDREVLDRVEEWIGEPLLVRRKVSRILLDGRLYNYPIDLRDLVANGSAALALKALCGYAAAQLTSPPEADDFRSFLVGRFGEPLYDTFFGPYTEKLCGCPSSELSMDLATGAVPQTGVVRQLFHRMIGRVEPWDDFCYPSRGFREIPKGMGREITARGGKILLRHRVARIRLQGDRIAFVQASSEDGPVELPADRIVSTIPLPAVLRALDPPPPPDVLAAADALRHRAMVGVYLGIRRRRLSEDHWIYVSDPSIRFNRLSETTNYSETMAPHGCTGICAEIACDLGDSVWSEGDEAQALRAAEDLVKIGLLRSIGDVEAAWVHRAPSAYPVYRVGYRTHLDVVARALAEIPDLEICGRQGAFWYGSTAQGIRQGLDLAARLSLAEAAVAAA